MSENEFGLDVRYHGQALKSIVDGIERYTPDELYRALTRIISVIPSHGKEQLQSQLQAANERINVLEEALQAVKYLCSKIQKDHLHSTDKFNSGKESVATLILAATKALEDK